jgi:thioredoxin-related protein
MGVDYDVSVIPTLFVLDSAGTVVKRITGVVPADDLTAILDDLTGQ